MSMWLGLQALQAGVDLAQHPGARVVAFVRGRSDMALPSLVASTQSSRWPLSRLPSMVSDAPLV
jgi:hypothetical protein